MSHEELTLYVVIMQDRDFGRGVEVFAKVEDAIKRAQDFAEINNTQTLTELNLTEVELEDGWILRGACPIGGVDVFRKEVK